MWESKEAAIVREMIFKENDLVNHRVTWLVTLQGLLFAALSFAWKDGKQLVGVLVLLGIGVSLTSFVGLLCADRAIQKLAYKWEKKKDPSYDGPGVIGLNNKNKGFKIILPWFVLPILFAGAWILVLCVAIK